MVTAVRRLVAEMERGMSAMARGLADAAGAYWAEQRKRCEDALRAQQAYMASLARKILREVDGGES